MSEVLEKWPGRGPRRGQLSPYVALLDGRIYRFRRGEPGWTPNVGIPAVRMRCVYWAKKLNLRVVCHQESADSVIIQAFPKTQAPQ